MSLSWLQVFFLVQAISRSGCSLFLGMVGMMVAWLGIATDLEALELLACTPVEGQCIAPVLVQLGRHMQALVLKLVVEGTDA